MGSILPHGRYQSSPCLPPVTVSITSTQHNPPHGGFVGPSSNDYCPQYFKHITLLIRYSSLRFGSLRNEIRHEAHIAEFFLAP